MRRAAVLLALVLAAAAATTGFSRAAFVTSTESAKSLSADSVERWIGLTAPDASCRPPTGTQTTGEDGALRLLATAGTTVECAFVVRARTDAPGQFALNVAPDPDSPGPITSASVTSGAGDLLGPSDTRTVRVNLNSAPGTGKLLVTVRLAGETPGFLRYSVPVTTVAGGPGPDPNPKPNPDPSPNPNPNPNPGPGTTDPTGQTQTTDNSTITLQPPTTTPVQPVRPAPKPAKEASKSCVSRRYFTIRIRAPRGAVLRTVKVTARGKKVRVRRRGSRLMAVLDMRGAPRGTVKVRIVARTKTGRRLTGTRTYHLCTPKLPTGKAPRL